MLWIGLTIRHRCLKMVTEGFRFFILSSLRETTLLRLLLLGTCCVDFVIPFLTRIGWII